MPDTSMTYADYLSLDALLDLQKRRGDTHDELLFIVMHQTQELWIKQILAELDEAQRCIVGGSLAVAYKCLARVSRIQTVMTLSWDILATMTPADYMGFRALLGSSSGFQSWQFRALECRLGLKDPAFLAHLPEGSHERERLAAAFAAPSLRDVAIERLRAAGVLGAAAGPQEVEDAWLQVYREPALHWELYELAEKLVDIDDSLAAWRQKHVLTVERIIGRKRGTGGTEGVGYLESTLRKRCFPELWAVRTRL